MSHNKFCSYWLKNFRDYLRSNSRNSEIMYLIIDSLLFLVRLIFLFNSFFRIFYDDNNRHYAYDNVQFIVSKILMQTLNKSCFIIKYSRFTCVNRCCSCFFNSFVIFIELIQLTSISSSLDIKILCAWIEISSCSSTCFSENELLSILITSLIQLCKDDSAENLRLRT